MGQVSADLEPARAEIRSHLLPILSALACDPCHCLPTASKATAGTWGASEKAQQPPRVTLRVLWGLMMVSYPAVV